MPLPRGLFSLSLLWVLASFVAAVGAGTPIQPTAGAYLPGARAFLALLALGIAVVWPIARLTVGTGRWTPMRAALDTAVVVLLLQGACWPIHLVTPWSLERAAAIDLLLSGWAIAAGAAIAIGGRSERGRIRWSLAALAVAGGGAVADMAGLPEGIAATLGPFAALLRLEAAGAGSDPVEWAAAAWPWVLAAAGWGLAARPADGTLAPPGTIR